MLPTSLEVFGIAGSAPTAVIVELSKNPVLTSGAFDQTAGSDVSMVDLYVSAIDATGGTVLLTTLVSPVAGGVTVKGIDLTDVFAFSGEVVTRRATIGASSDIFTVQVRAIVGSADLSATLNWKEIL
jgi:hypothetical protein